MLLTPLQSLSNIANISLFLNHNLTPNRAGYVGVV